MTISAAQLATSNPYTLWDVLGQSSESESTSLISQPVVQSQSSIQDELTLSPEGEAAANSGMLDLLTSALFPWMPKGSNGAIRLGDMEKYCSEQSAKLNTRIKEAFKEAGIDTSKQIRLQTGSDGSVVVANEHPQRAEIEQIFKDDPELRNQFVQVDAMSSFVHSGIEALAFQRAYAKDPEAAVEKYSYLFDDSSRPQFGLLVKGNDISVEFAQ
jgi:hypothetical protein